MAAGVYPSLAHHSGYDLAGTRNLDRPPVGPATLIPWRLRKDRAVAWPDPSSMLQRLFLDRIDPAPGTEDAQEPDFEGMSE